MEVFLIILNLLISIWNAFVWGYTRREFKIMGWRSFGWWLSWSIFVMSAVGFFMVYLILGALIAVSNGWMEPDAVKLALELGFVIMYPLLMAAGLCILLHSWAQTFKHGGFVNWGVSVWNTYAFANNVSVGVSHYGSAFDSVGSGIGELFSDGLSMDGDGDSMPAIGFIILVGICLVLAFGSTLLIGHWSGKLNSDLSQDEFDSYIKDAKTS